MELGGGGGGGGGGGDQYGLPDLRHFMAGRTHFPVTSSHPSEPSFFVRRPQFEPIMVGEFLPRGLIAAYDSSTANTASAVATAPPAAASASATCRLDMEMSGWGGNEGGNSRWPRQETLTLLEIRSRLDSKFKEANQKGPLWDEVSRIMAEEHGYQRSGKKCREKFENLYKYYKKTKEGKAGRHDGKHYRFFRQLEAICGETSTTNTNNVNNNNNQTSSASETHLPINNNNPSSLSAQTPNSKFFKQENYNNQESSKLCESLSFTNSSEFETSSSENNEDDLSAIAFMMKQPKNMMNANNLESSKQSVKVKKSWKTKVKEFVDLQMKKLVETQEAWMEKTLKAIEDREQERLRKEEQWRKQEEARFSREHEFWAKERAWVEARDVALMEALKKFTGKNLQDLSSSSMEGHHHHNKNPETSSEELCINETITNNNGSWTEPEFSTLLQLRASVDLRYNLEEGYMKEGIWEEISSKMTSLGYDRSAFECKEKWENMNMYFNMASAINESNKKRREELRTSNYFDLHHHHHQTDQFYNGHGVSKQKNDNNLRFGSSSQQVQENNFQVLMAEGGNWWGECELNLSKEKNQHG